MASKSEWGKGVGPIDADSNERLFFTAHEWATVEAAAARIYPTDDTPGATEAGVVLYIDRYLSGIDYIYATADGSGFLKLSGKHADAWRARIRSLQQLYRDGIEELDSRAEKIAGGQFKTLTPDQQDRVLEDLSGAPKPKPIKLTDTGNLGTMLQGVSDQGVAFFTALTIHTRQGMFCDPAYGGNRNRIGWKLVGFPGPKSLKETNDATFSVKEYFVHDYDWNELIPHLKAQGSS